MQKQQDFTAEDIKRDIPILEAQLNTLKSDLYKLESAHNVLKLGKDTLSESEALNVECAEPLNHEDAHLIMIGQGAFKEGSGCFEAMDEIVAEYDLNGGEGSPIIADCCLNMQLLFMLKNLLI